MHVLETDMQQYRVKSFKHWKSEHANDMYFSGTKYIIHYFIIWSAIKFYVQFNQLFATYVNYNWHNQASSD